MMPLVAASVKNYEIGNMNNPMTSDAVARSKQMVIKCLNQLSTNTEMSGSHVASLLLGHEDKYTSHQFKSLNLHHFFPLPSQTNATGSDSDKHEENEEHEEHDALIQWGNDDSLVLVSTKTDYLNRGTELTSLCLYDYIAIVDKIAKTADRKRSGETSQSEQRLPGRPKNLRVKYDPSHPQCKTHMQKIRSVPQIPVLTMFPP